MISFLLNDRVVRSNLAQGAILVDFIRYHRNLAGTKIGCREGDCGACTILCGTLKDDQVQYRTMTSCLMPLANAAGKHIVTVEGINADRLTPVQHAISEEAATQCGFCTPGIVMSLTGFCLQASQKWGPQDAIAAVDGNICRCTGYKSIERAALKIGELMHAKGDQSSLQFLIDAQVLPPYFSQVRHQLTELSQDSTPDIATNGHSSAGHLRAQFLGGGTDLYVQQPERMEKSDGTFLLHRNHMQNISEKDGRCWIGGTATVTDLLESPIFLRHFNNVQVISKLISSTPIRNMATISGNFVNASPIGDLTIIFLALNAELGLSNGHNTRSVSLRKFYLGYKTLDKKPDEFISAIHFALPKTETLFSFEKVSKRTNLDIASVNSALLIELGEGGEISQVGLSAGGVGPVPGFLEKTCTFLTGKQVNGTIIGEAISLAQTEVSPISDARGSANYKRLLLQQLIRSHFLKLFPGLDINQLMRAS